MGASWSLLLALAAVLPLALALRLRCTPRSPHTHTNTHKHTPTLTQSLQLAMGCLSWCDACAAASKLLSFSSVADARAAAEALPDHMYLETLSAEPSLLQKRFKTPAIEKRLQVHSAYMREPHVYWKASDRPPLRPYHRPPWSRGSKAIIYFSDCYSCLPCCGAPRQFMAEDTREEAVVPNATE